jgi:hypothetical protein
MHVSGDFHFHCEHRLASQPQAVKRSVTHKTRLFGPSHWANAAIMVGPQILYYTSLIYLSSVTV